ncbi:MAG: N-acetylglucosamine-6-phosphate deacetylase [Eubacteriales bacterium]|nr:N-acetylglucosamine-6-phosphate deacetylase [Eubacteriales bacterium]
MLLQNGKAFINGQFQDKTDLLLKDGKIAAIGTGLMADGEETIDLKGDYVLPGFVDVHIHAFMGKDTMNGEEAVRHMSRELKKHGVAAFLPTTMSASPEDTVTALKGIKAVMDRPEPNGAIVLGAHMEAPFLAESKAGAQLKQYFANPSEENWEHYTGGYEGIVRLITMAPEKEGALSFIKTLTDKGITVSIGHTDATAETVHAAADHGANHVTHTFNAQSPLNHRKPGVPGAAMVDARLNCEVISDGIHLHPDIVRMLMLCKGKEHTVAITDAMEAAGMPDGQYQLGGQDVFVKDGAARLADGTLAGSTLTMIRAFQNLMKFGATPEDAATMTTKTPALSIGNEDMGEIELGAPAILARFDQTFTFVETIG